MSVPVIPPTPAESSVHNPALALPEQYNVAVDLVDGALQRGWGDRIAIRFTAGDWTYSDLAHGVNRAGNALRALGTEMEQRIGVLLYDSPQFASVFFGAIKIGAVPVPLNTQLRAQDYLYMLNDSRARVLFVEADLWPLLQPLRNELIFLRHVVIVRRDGAQDASRDRAALDYDALTGGSLRDLTAAPTSRDDAAFWLYSSGSTGFPKGCVHLQHDIRCAIELYAKPLLGITEADTTFSAAKLFFAYGLGNGLYFSMAVGGVCVHYPGRITAEAAFQEIQ